MVNQDNHNSNSNLFLTIVLIIYLVIAHIFSCKKIKFIHESSLAILVGYFSCLCCYYFNSDSQSHKTIKFDPEIFFNFLLPPIIFNAGYALRKRHFFKNFWIINYLGIFSTLIVFVILSCLFYLINQTQNIQNQLSIQEIIIMACIMSGNDTVAGVNLIKEEYYPKLNSIIFGEGIVNDAIIIVLFRILQKGKLQQSSYLQYFQILLDFTTLVFTSILVGLSLSLLLSLFFKLSENLKHSPVKETALVFLNGYLSYMFSEELHFSGIMSLFVAAMVMSYYAHQNLSETSKQSIHLSLEVMASLSEAIVYVYLGVEFYNQSFSNYQFVFAFLIIFSLLAARFFTVFIFPFLQFVFGFSSELSLNEYKIVCYSGLIRGSISFALCLNTQSNNNRLLQISLLVILITTIFLSGLLESFANCIGLQPQTNKYDDLQTMFTNMQSDNEFDLQKQQDLIRNLQRSEEMKSNFFKKSWNHFDKRIMQPLFTKHKPRTEMNISLSERF